MLELFFAFAVAVQLFSELTAKEAKACAATLFTIPAAIVHDGGKEEPCTNEQLSHYSHVSHQISTSLNIKFPDVSF